MWHRVASRRVELEHFQLRINRVKVFANTKHNRAAAARRPARHQTNEIRFVFVNIHQEFGYIGSCVSTRLA